MIINTPIKINIDECKAFRILCGSLDMEYVLDENTKFFVRKDYDGNNCVYVLKNGHDELFDDRGDLFVALRNVAVNIFPNTYFRNADYIYNK